MSLKTSIDSLVANANTFIAQLGSLSAAVLSAQTSANNAAAVVTGGTAQLAAAPGKIPLGDGGGRIAKEWLGGLSIYGPGVGVSVGSCAKYKITSLVPALTNYYKLATLPATTGSTGDQLLINLIITTTSSNYRELLKIIMGQRSAFTAATLSYQRATASILSDTNKIEAWQNADGSTDVYVVAGAGENIALYAELNTTGFAQQAVLVAPESVVGTTIAPIGTLLYSSATEYLNASQKTVLGVVAGQNGIGYVSGQGGAVSQVTGVPKSTGVTLAKTTGQIALSDISLAANTTVQFTLTNTYIAATDVLLLNHVGGGTLGAYLIQARCAAGSAVIAVRNITAAALAESLTLQFVLVKGVIA